MQRRFIVDLSGKRYVLTCREKKMMTTWSTSTRRCPPSPPLTPSGLHTLLDRWNEREKGKVPIMNRKVRWVGGTGGLGVATFAKWCQWGANNDCGLWCELNAERHHQSSSVRKPAWPNYFIIEKFICWLEGEADIIDTYIGGRGKDWWRMGSLFIQKIFELWIIYYYFFFLIWMFFIAKE